MCDIVLVRKLTCCRKADCLPKMRKKDTNNYLLKILLLQLQYNYSYDPTKFDDIVNICKS